MSDEEYKMRSGVIEYYTLADIERWEKIAGHIWNYLALSDPNEIAAWVRRAREVIQESQEGGETWKS